MCNKGLGWNKKYTIELYGNHKANQSEFLSQLTPTHPYFQMIKEHITYLQTQPPPSQVTPFSSTNSSLLKLTEYQMDINKFK